MTTPRRVFSPKQKKNAARRAHAKRLVTPRVSKLGAFAIERTGRRKRGMTIRTHGFYAPGEGLFMWFRNRLNAPPIASVKHIDPKTGKVFAIYDPETRTRTQVEESGGSECPHINP